MKMLPLLILVTVLCPLSYAQNCPVGAKVSAPVIDENTRKVYQAKLDEARTDYEKNRSADTLIWLGRRTAYLGNYKEAIRIFDGGISNFPGDPRLFRHRGHRFITLRCFDNAIKDLETAARLVKGKEDEIEPDGLPNARNLPTSTLQTNIFYHLGLAYYLKGEFKKALTAYRKCLKVSKNNDMSVATIHWLYMTLRRLGKLNDAQRIIETVDDDLDLIESMDYYRLIKLYQGKLKVEDLSGNDFDALSSVSLGYGVGNWLLYNDKRSEGLRIFRMITRGNQWASFGFIAAEAELKR